MKKYSIHIIWAVVAIVLFVGGMYYGQSLAAANPQGGRGAFASSTRGGFAGRNGGGFVMGQIASVDSQSLTIQLPNGNSQIVFYSSSTSVIKPMPAPVSSLTAGTQVLVGGTQNSDGSLTAQTIQVRTGNSMVGGSAGGSGGGQ